MSLQMRKVHFPFFNPVPGDSVANSPAEEIWGGRALKSAEQIYKIIEKFIHTEKNLVVSVWLHSESYDNPLYRDEDLPIDHTGPLPERRPLFFHDVDGDSHTYWILRKDGRIFKVEYGDWEFSCRFYGGSMRVTLPDALQKHADGI